jgi:hypothetical protein
MDSHEIDERFVQHQETRLQRARTDPDLDHGVAARLYNLAHLDRQAASVEVATAIQAALHLRHENQHNEMLKPVKLFTANVEYLANGIQETVIETEKRQPPVQCRPSAKHRLERRLLLQS